MNTGSIHFFKPKNKKLSPLIKGYCIHTSEQMDFKHTIRFYQNTTNTISIYKDSVTSGSGICRVQTFQPNSGLNTLLVGLIDGYQEVTFLGPLQRLAVIFHAGGLNHFIKQPLSQFLKPNFSSFDYFNQEFNDLIPQLFSITQVGQQTSLLDDFFVSHLIDFKQKPLLRAIAMIDLDNTIKVQDLALQVGLHRRTLLRQFRLHLGLSVEAYKQSRRFRSALFKFQESNGEVKLTDIAHESQFYDQADFTHQLKVTSGLTPSELFSKLKIIDDTLFWVH